MEERDAGVSRCSPVGEEMVSRGAACCGTFSVGYWTTLKLLSFLVSGPGSGGRGPATLTAFWKLL